MARAQASARRDTAPQQTEAPAGDPGEDEAPMDGADPASPLGRFSAELGRRWPDTLIKRFVMPSRVRECREIFIREIDSKDEVRAAALADVTMSAVERSSERLANEAENRECIRLSIVGVGRFDGEGAMAYEMCNHDEIPLVIAGWKRPAWISLFRYFPQVNGVSEAEIMEGIMEARVVGAHASPTSGTPASAARGR